MLHYVQQARAVSAVQYWAGSWHIQQDLFHRKQLPAVAKNNTMKAVSANQNSDVAAGELTHEVKLILKL